jgi:PIN domain
VLLDVAQNRPQFYQDSEEVLARSREGDYEAVIPAHLVTTFHYVMAKFSGRSVADVAVDGLLADFNVVGTGSALLVRARGLPMTDFEDNVVAAVAEASKCAYIVTRNVPDFAGSPVPAVTPADFLKLLPPRVPPAVSEPPDLT